MHLYQKAVAEHLYPTVRIHYIYSVNWTHNVTCEIGLNLYKCSLLLLITPQHEILVIPSHALFLLFLPQTLVSPYIPSFDCQMLLIKYHKNNDAINLVSSPITTAISYIKAYHKNLLNCFTAPEAHKMLSSFHSLCVSIDWPWLRGRKGFQVWQSRLMKIGVVQYSNSTWALNALKWYSHEISGFKNSKAFPLRKKSHYPLGNHHAIHL